MIEIPSMFIGDFGNTNYLYAVIFMGAMALIISAAIVMFAGKHISIPSLRILRIANMFVQTSRLFGVMGLAIFVSISLRTMAGNPVADAQNSFSLGWLAWAIFGLFNIIGIICLVVSQLINKGQAVEEAA